MDQSTINILFPALTAFIATVVTAYWSFRVQRAQVQAQTVTAARAAAEEAERQTWEQITQWMNTQKETMASQRKEIDELRTRLDDADEARKIAAADRERERVELMENLKKTTDDLNKVSWELAESYKEINELREVLIIVRKENTAQKVELDKLHNRVLELEAENHTLKSIPSAPRGKI